MVVGQCLRKRHMHWSSLWRSDTRGAKRGTLDGRAIALARIAAVSIHGRITRSDDPGSHCVLVVARSLGVVGKRGRRFPVWIAVRVRELHRRRREGGTCPVERQRECKQQT